MLDREDVNNRFVARVLEIMRILILIVDDRNSKIEEGTRILITILKNVRELEFFRK